MNTYRELGYAFEMTKQYAKALAAYQKGLSLARSVPVRHRHGAAFELERSGDTVARLKPVAFEGLRMGVGIDEAGRDHETRDVDGGAADKRCAAHRRDSRAADADVADGVGPRLWIHDASACEHQVEGLVLRGIDALDEK